MKKVNVFKSFLAFIMLSAPMFAKNTFACDQYLEDSGAITTVCANGNGTYTFTVNSGFSSYPGACVGAASGCQYSYVA
jgi:hypothetical protein